jgi:hypothetical protein
MLSGGGIFLFNYWLWLCFGRVSAASLVPHFISLERSKSISNCGIINSIHGWFTKKEVYMAVMN